jgi:hypothetical protein
MSRLSITSKIPFLRKPAYNFVYANVARQQRKANKPILSQVASLKGKHEGEACFIIGTGPSLRIEDLEKLKGIVSFAPNRIYELLDKTSWRPTYYMCQDHAIIRKFAERIESVESKLSFLPVNYANQFHGDKYRFFVLQEKDFYPGDAPFSTDPSKRIYQGYTVTYGAIQMAIYMGFKEIYLLGVDHNYSIVRDAQGRPVRKNDNANNYPAGMSQHMDQNNLPRIEETTIAYETAEKLSAKYGVKIYNATRGGKLEAFERIDFDTIINKLHK